MPADGTSRRRMIEFELEIDAAVADETIVAPWGRAFLIGSVPGWEAERIEYMAWREESGREAALRKSPRYGPS